MSNRKLAAIVFGVASIVVLSLLISDGRAQTQSAAGVSNGSAAGNGSKAARTPWGEPDLQGIWSSGYIEIPLERPEKFQGREFLTEEEVQAETKRLASRQDHSTGGPLGISTKQGDIGRYNTIFSGRGREVIRAHRTSLVIDPPDGKIPWKPELRGRTFHRRSGSGWETRAAGGKATRSSWTRRTSATRPITRARARTCIWSNASRAPART